MARHLNVSLERLGTDYVDLCDQHRVSPAVSVERTHTDFAKLRDLDGQ